MFDAALSARRQDSTGGTDEASFATVLDQAITARGIPLRRLSEVLADRGDPVSVAALSYWRSGRRAPQNDASFDAVRRLEEVLLLDEGTLTSRIPARSTPGPDNRRSFDDLGRPSEVGTNAVELHRQIGLSVRDTVITSSYQRYDIGADRQIIACHQRSFWTARVDGARTVAVTWHYDSPGVEPAIRSVTGARLGETLFDTGTMTFTGELILPRALKRGEMVITEHTIENLRERDDVTALENIVERRADDACLWIHFTKGSHPTACTRYTTSEKGRETAKARLMGGSLTQIVRGFGPGVIGFRWRWPD